MKLRVLSACAACVVACGGHEDVTPLIPVQAGAAARAMALLGHGGPNDPSARAAAAGDAGADATAPAATTGKLAFACLEARGAMKVLARVPCIVTLAPRSPSVATDEIEIVSASGKIAATVPAGAYRVTSSRGPEYALASWDIEVLAGKVTWGPNEGATVLRRVVDTRGYLAADLYARAPDAGDPGDEARDAILADVTSGIEVALGDDVAPIVQGAKLEDLLEPLEPFDLGAVEAWNGGGDGARDAFLARITAKHPVTPIASPPARTYVRVDDDGSLVTWSPSRQADLVRGVRDRRDVVVTTGPFLRVAANGAPIGGVARVLGDKDVEVKVHVECAPWVAVDRVSLVRVSGIAVEPQTVVLRPTPTEARAADVTFHLHATTDDAFVVLAESSATASDDATPMRAMSGALWIDADGDGESLGRTEPRPVPRETRR